jgi:hypothetical protein
MAATILRKLLDNVRRLTPDEQRQLREALDRLLASPSAPPTEEQFEQELVDSGILNDVPASASAGQSSPGWKPVDVKGKPLSETIVEDRR